MSGRRSFRSGRCPAPSAKSAQLHQGRGGLCLPGKCFPLFSSDARISCAVRHAHQSRGQAPNQEHHLPHGQGLDNCDGRREGGNPGREKGRRQGQRRNVASPLNRVDFVVIIFEKNKKKKEKTNLSSV